eukprot:2651883-Rhodomonas_salina.1
MPSPFLRRGEGEGERKKDALSVPHPFALLLPLPLSLSLSLSLSLPPLSRPPSLPRALSLSRSFSQARFDSVIRIQSERSNFSSAKKALYDCINCNVVPVYIVLTTTFADPRDLQWPARCYKNECLRDVEFLLRRISKVDGQEEKVHAMHEDRGAVFMVGEMAGGAMVCAR